MKRRAKTSSTSKLPSIKYAPPMEMLDYQTERISAFSDVHQNPKPATPERCLHAHPHYELLYITRGVREFYMQGKSHKAEAGDLMIFQPYAGHVEYAGTQKTSYIVFRISQTDLAKAKMEFPHLQDNNPVINLPHKQKFSALFDSMIEEYSRPQDGSETLLGAYLVEFIIKLRRSLKAHDSSTSKPGAPSRARVRMAMDILEENFAQRVNLHKLAHQTFMSVSNLSHSFKEQVGLSPRRYQIRERIRQAKTLLLETDKPATEIANHLGYSSIYFFYRQFRSKTGMTTAEFRERFKK